MTYRKLYLWILVMAAVMLLGIWWVSLRTYAGVFLAPGGWHRATCGGVIATLTPGTITVGHAADVTWPDQFSFGTAPLADFNGADSPESIRLEEQGRWGTFHIGRQTPIGVPPSVLPYVVAFPVWLPWFLLAGGGYAVMRRMEKRSRGLKEKELAETAVAGGVVE